jgi:hypothetical protein
MPGSGLKTPMPHNKPPAIATAWAEEKLKIAAANCGRNRVNSLASTGFSAALAQHRGVDHLCNS